MFDSFTILHPQTPPSWLDDWPTPDQIDQNFPTVLRRIANTFAHRLTEASLEWTDTLIRAKMGTHMCTWNKLPDGTWKKRCTCGAPDGKCPHVYITCLLLQKVFMQEKWVEKTTGQRYPHASAYSPRTYRPTPQQMELKTRPSQLFHTSLDETDPHKLIVEVDFKHEPGQATLRLYDKTISMAEPMRLNAIYNLGFRLKRENHIPGWNQQDRDFLAWLFPIVARIDWRVRNKNVLKIPRQEFAAWQEHWKGNPERFIEKFSQAFLQISNLTTPVNLTVELVPEGDFVRLKAAFVLPGGTSLPVHDFFTKLETNPEKDDLIKKIKNFNPPIPWPILSQHFSKHPPRLRRELIPQHLGELLNGRLEVVRGDCVKTESPEDLQPSVMAEISGNRFALEARLGGQPLPLDSNLIPQATIRDDGTKFIITLPGSQAAAKLRETMAAFQPMGAERSHAKVLFPQNPHNAQLMKHFWHSLPEPFAREAAPRLAHLLEPSQKQDIQAVITTKQEGPLALLDLQWNVDGEQLSHRELLRIAQSNQNFFRSESGTWLDISREEAQRALETLGQTDLTPGKDNPLLAARATEHIQKLQKDLHAILAPSTHQFLHQIAQQPPPHLPEPDRKLTTILRAYQTQGMQFLIDRTACGAGAILADDMGLGKTLQVLAAIDAWRRQAQRRHETFQALAVTPASVMSVWMQQAKQFCPNLTVRIIQGTPEQRQHLIATATENLLVTHYTLARIDHEELQRKTFDFLILDEAQAIKNPEAQVTQAIAGLQARHAIALTGTPLENSIADLWSIMTCINPGFLGPLDTFIGKYGTSPEGLTRLNRKIKPLLLRRTKKMVDLELPPKTEQTITIEMTPEQRTLYAREVALGKLKLKEKGPGEILGVLTRLRQICCHPDLATHEENSAESAKLQRLVEQLVTLNGSGHAALVFSQFTSMLQLIAKELTKLNIPFLTITGNTSLSQREILVRQFQDAPEPTVFLLSLKAAGTGLTLTRADYVFLYDPWWNPAVEQQAIDRTHRIGQTKPVVAYKFITANSVEEKVSKLLQQKRDLFNAVLQDDDQDNPLPPARLTYQELRALLD